MIEILDAFGTPVASCTIVPVKLSSRRESGELRADIMEHLAVAARLVLPVPPGADERMPWSLRTGGPS